MLIVKSWGELRETIQKFEKKPLLLTATDGNHGYALAFAAKSLGCQAIIFMPKVNIFKLITLRYRIAVCARLSISGKNI